MSKELSSAEAVKFRELWEVLLLNNKINVCTEKLKNANIIDVNILRILANNPNMSMKDIIQKLNVPNSTLTNAITRLEKHGLVKRSLLPEDLRSYRIELTIDGIQAITEHRQKEQEILNGLLSALNEEEKKTFINLFERLVNNI